LTIAVRGFTITARLWNEVVMDEQLSAVFGALADPTRRAILARLTLGDATVAELSAPFSVTQPAISKHLKVLEGAGLISRTRRATARLSHLEAEPLREATQWLVGYRTYWEESHDRLDELLARLQSEPDGGPDPRRVARRGAAIPGHAGDPAGSSPTGGIDEQDRHHR
jgi:DNA-binding transcriptional ArsR family regulator